MGREFELKYRSTPEALEALERQYGDFTTISMETTYYDTFDGKLSARHWTLRRRYENGTAVCTLKTPGEGGGRSEWEVEARSIMAGIPKLCKLGAPMLLMELTVSGIREVCGAKFTRRAKQLALPGATVELALDQGCLLGGGREMPLLEVEVEVKDGSEAEAVRFAQSLAQAHRLIPEPRSKYSRALALAKGEV